MKQIIKTIVLSSVLLFAVALPFVTGVDVSAATALEAACQADPSATVCNQGDVGSVNTILGVVVNTLLFVVGAIAVIMIIVSGVRYTTSGGDSGAVSAAKNTLLYSVIGLLVAFFAYAIVNWVLDVF